MVYSRYTRGSSTEWGIREECRIHSLSGVDSGVSLEDIGNRNFSARMSNRVEERSLETIPMESVKILAPTCRPNKIVVVGLNYEDRVEEYNREPPDHPILYGKASSAITNPGDPILYPPDIEKLDYEVELAVVIGKRGKNIPFDSVQEFIAGYTVVNDVSARDAHSEDDVAFRGNSYDTFAPLGPVLVPPERIDPNDLGISLSVNGETKQESHTSNFIFQVEELVEYISQVMTLYPGDVICTGTPGGAGIYRDPPELLEPGDTVEAHVESIGTLVSEVVAD